MADEKGQEKKSIPNEISPVTGEFDARFMLWRQFCAENDVPVETLPSALTGETKERWETLKNKQLHKDSDK